MDQNWMNNTTVIVTGASGGMGKGIAESLIVDHGCTVIGIARSEEKMKKVVEELGPNAEKFSYKLFDVSVEQNWIDFESTLRIMTFIPTYLSIMREFCRSSTDLNIIQWLISKRL